MVFGRKCWKRPRHHTVRLSQIRVLKFVTWHCKYKPNIVLGNLFRASEFWNSCGSVNEERWYLRSDTVLSYWSSSMFRANKLPSSSGLRSGQAVTKKQAARWCYACCTFLVVPWLTFQPWRRWQYVRPKRPYPIRLHGILYQIKLSLHVESFDIFFIYIHGSCST